MQRGGICAGAALAVLWAASSAFAQAEGSADEVEGYARTGVYAGLAGSVAFEDFDSGLTLPGLAGAPISVAYGDFDPSLGLHARGGYRLHPNVAAEVHLEWLSGFDGSVRIGGGAPMNATLEALAFGANLKLYPLRGRFQPFVTLGAGALQIEETGTGADEWDFAGRLGGGIDVYVTEQIAVSLDTTYVLPTDLLQGYEYVSFGWGLLYRF